MLTPTCRSVCIAMRWILARRQRANDWEYLVPGVTLRSTPGCDMARSVRVYGQLTITNNKLTTTNYQLKAKIFCQFSKKLPLKKVGTHATRIFSLHAFRVRVCVAELCVVENKKKRGIRMGTKDKTTRRLEAYNDVFADIINVLVFNGERRVLEDDLADVDTKSEFVADDKGLRGQDRDIAKFWEPQNIRLAMFGLENQSVPNAIMPLRIYSYNGASYKAQIIPRKPMEWDNDGISLKSDEKAARNAKSRQPYYPVLTLVLYFGLTPWNAPKTLYEAVHVPEEMKPFIPDLPINLVEVAWLEDAVIDKFQSDFKVVAKFFKQLRLRGETCLDMNDPSLSQTITHFLDLMRLMSAYSHDPRFEAEALKLPTEKERNMLAVLTKLEDKGRKEGFSTLNRVYENLLNHGRQDDLIRAIRDPEYQKQIMAEFGLAEDEAHNIPK